MIMKYVNFFLIPLLLLGSCQKGEKEDVIDLDQMVLTENEVNQHLAGEPLENPQEMLTDEEPDSVE